ncbi:hypothetical protein FS749_003954 [Ceratobasidium sp. UAMH 11750]|nr:hypothetical protein FS749_003954 [Ceratobasidium sp. UAMH 11750]
MAPINNVSAIFNGVPQAAPVVGKTIITRTDKIDLDAVQLNGGILVKTLYLSVEPHLRALMSTLSPGLDTSTYKLGEPYAAESFGSLNRTNAITLTLETISLSQTAYAVLPANHTICVIPNDPEVPLSVYLGFLGMPGMTAFYGLELVGKPKKGETFYVSSGAGPVGSIVAQLAKLNGLKVIASASTNEKVEFIRSIGIDVPFNYKTQNMKEILAKEGPIDLYWDNVGGPTLEAALEACNVHARVVVCGAISGYDPAAEPYGIKYVVNEGEPEYEGQAGNPLKFLAAITPLVKSGKLKWSEQVLEGVEHVGKAIVDVLEGRNTAKVVIKANDF